MSDERKPDESEQTDQAEDASDSSQEATLSPDERLDDVGNKGTFDLEGGEAGEERESGTAGLPDEDDVPEETLKEIDDERSSRLDPDNRPDNVEVDNTPRTFDSGAGMFTDNPEYDKDNRPYAGPEDSGPPEESESSQQSEESDESERSSGQDAPEDASDTSEAEEQESTEEASSEDEPATSPKS